MTSKSCSEQPRLARSRHPHLSQEQRHIYNLDPRHFFLAERERAALSPEDVKNWRMERGNCQHTTLCCTHYSMSLPLASDKHKPGNTHNAPFPPIEMAFPSIDHHSDLNIFDWHQSLLQRSVRADQMKCSGGGY